MAWPPTIGVTATLGVFALARAARAPGTARIGATLTNGLDGQTTMPRRPAVSSRAGCALAASAPAKRTDFTTGSQRSRTNQSWKAISPWAVVTIVRTGSSDIGTIV